MKKCRICSEDISELMSFGQMPIANGFAKSASAAKTLAFEMSVGFCDNCKMFQLLQHPEPAEMFNENYAFFSGTSDVMRDHFSAFFSSVISKYNLKKNDCVLEIGCNDGILIENFAREGFVHVGVEPSANVAKVAKTKGINCRVSFFDTSLVDELLDEDTKASLIVAANVICHIPDLNELASNVNRLLTEEGVFVFEEPYLGEMLSKNSYDQIYDEHIYIFSASALANAFGRHGLRLIDVERQITHGGSMRYHFSKIGSSHQESENVGSVLTEEAEKGLCDPNTFDEFRKGCEASRAALIDLLSKLKAKGAKICGYGATSKSTTILNYCGLGPETISFICDTTPFKQGKFTPGKGIPVVKPEAFYDEDPDYAVLFAWNHEKEILEKEAAIGRNKAKWIRFFPRVEVFGD